MQNVELKIPDDEQIKHEVDQLFEGGGKRRRRTGVRQKRKGRNLGGAKKVKR